MNKYHNLFFSHLCSPMEKGSPAKAGDPQGSGFHYL